MGRVGINLSNLPRGATAPLALLFVALIALCCAVVAAYWFGTTIFTYVSSFPLFKL